MSTQEWKRTKGPKREPKREKALKRRDKSREFTKEEENSDYFECLYCDGNIVGEFAQIF